VVRLSRTEIDFTECNITKCEISNNNHLVIRIIFIFIVNQNYLHFIQLLLHTFLKYLSYFFLKIILLSFEVKKI